MEKTDILTSPCSDQCWHTASKQCPQYVECMHKGPLCHKSIPCAEKKQQVLAVIRHEVNDETLVYIGTGTCGLGAGAAKTKKAIEHYCVEKKLDVRIIETGCIGLCSSEPIVDIQLPNRSRVSFKNITEDRVAELFDVVTKNTIPANLVLGQFKTKATSWEEVPILKLFPVAGWRHFAVSIYQAFPPLIQKYKELAVLVPIIK